VTANKTQSPSLVFAIEVPDGAATVLQPSPFDMVFLLLLGVALAAIGLVGWRAYDDAHKEFQALSNARVWAQWLGEAGLQRGKADFHPQACALAVSKNEQPPLAILLEGSGRELLLSTESGQGRDALTKPASDGSWRACEQVLREARGALSGLRNPYSGEVQTSAVRCDAADPRTAGALVLEKAKPSLVEPRPLAFTALAAEDLIQSPLKLRVSVCDRWGRIHRVADLDF